MPYEIQVADTAIGHLAALTARERSTVIEGRVGALRVFYDITSTERRPGPPAVVRILAVGKKERNVLRIGGKVVEL